MKATVEHNFAPSTRFPHHESKALSRALFISAGRKFFLLNGFVATTAEQICEEAGFVCATLHCTFEDKEGLFMEVVRQCHQRHEAIFANLLRRFSGRALLDKLRGALADLLKDPEYRLIVELQLEALNNKRLKRGYVALNQEMVASARNILEGIFDSSNIRLALKPEDGVVAMMSFIRGDTANQTVPGPAALSEAHSRNLVFAVFDCCLDPASLRIALRRQRS